MIIEEKIRSKTSVNENQIVFDTRKVNDRVVILLKTASREL